MSEVVRSDGFQVTVSRCRELANGYEIAIMRPVRRSGDKDVRCSYDVHLKGRRTIMSVFVIMENTVQMR